MSSAKKSSGKPQRSAIADVVAREYTIHMHKRVCYISNSILSRYDSKSARDYETRDIGAMFG